MKWNKIIIITIIIIITMICAGKHRSIWIKIGEWSKIKWLGPKSADQKVCKIWSNEYE